MRIIIGFLMAASIAGGLAYGQKFENHTEVRSENGKVNLYINGDKTLPFAYMSYLGEETYFQQMTEAGVDLFCLLAYMGDEGINSSSGIKPFRPSFWKGMGEYDFSVVEKEFESLTKVKPDAKAIVRVHLDAPLWWGEQNQSELCRLPDGSPHRVSFASQKWRIDAGDALTALLEWIRRSPYNRNLVGIHLAAGFTEEWFFHYKDHFYDESDARLYGFREWLRQQYDYDQKGLKTAWKLPEISFETAMPSDISGKERGQGFRKKGEDRQLDDTYAYHGQIMSDHIAHFARLVKQVSGNRLLTGAFYGYHLFVHDPRRGHGALGSLLASPHLDYLSSPNDYRREVGVDWLPMAAVKSVQLHGKLWMAENDTRTSSTTLLRDRAPHIVPDEGDAYDKGVWIGPRDPELSKDFLWKNAARMLAYGYGGWWFDMWGGWFSEPGLMQVIEGLNNAYELYEMDDEAQSDVPYHPEVAVVVNEKLAFFDAGFGAGTGRLLANRYALGNMGTPFDVFLLSDVDKLKGKGYKVIWYLGLHDISEQQTAAIRGLKKETACTIETDIEGSVVTQKGVKNEAFDGRVDWTPAQLREVCARAGVHIFSAADDVVYAGNGWLSVHFGQSGKREILLPDKWLLVDIKEEADPLIANRIELDGQAGETILFRVEK